jgi:hypothetical protein
MEEIIVILFLIGLAVLILPITALVIAIKASRSARESREALRILQRTVSKLESDSAHPRAILPESRPAPKVEPAPPRDEPKWDEPALSSPAVVESPRTVIPGPSANNPPPLPVERVAEAPGPEEPSVAFTSPESPEDTKPAFSLEHFMGVKLFAWIGGIAMFFGVIYFVKYAFENNIITEAGRIALGFITGAGLLVGGLWTHRKDAYRILAQSLCATGILVLYGVSFAAYAVYHFDAFSQPVTFLLMSLITIAAFLIAVRLDAQVVAALGMIGGFLSPVLLSTGEDHPIGLFSYIALLNVGVLATTRFKPWRHLPTAAGLGTMIMQVGWFHRFFRPETYGHGTATLIPMGILLAFTALYTIAAWDTKRKRPEDSIHSGAALALSALAMGFSFYFLSFNSIAERPFLLYGFILLINIVPLAISIFERKYALAHFFAAIATFVHLAIWNDQHLKPELLTSALIIYLVFGAIHACFPLIRPHIAKTENHPLSLQLAPWLAPAALVLIFLTVQTHHNAPLTVWIAVLLIDALVIWLAFKTQRITLIISTLVLTFLISHAWLGHLPALTKSLTPLLAVIVAFGGLFATTGLWWIRMAGALLPKGPSERKILTQPELLTVLSAVLPFAMLVLVIHKLPLPNPSPVFGVALLLGVLLLGLMLLAKRPLLAPTALLCTLAVEYAWFTERFSPSAPWVTLGWYVGFYAIFAAFAFVFRKNCENQITPWAGSAIASVGHFLLIHPLVRDSFPRMDGMMGLVPLAFAIPSILAMRSLIQNLANMDLNRQRQLAWLGGVALLFITLIFPIQFSRQWLTVSWALEGAALIWLFRKVPHIGLKWTAMGLLVTAFIRLTLNPDLFTTYARSGTAIFNWHLYTYGIVVAATLLAGKLLPREHQQFGKLNLSGLCYGFAGILLFVLLNIEIADFFTEPGKHYITFQFGGNFARDMTYSIAWGLFSLGLLVIGIAKRTPIARYAAIVLLAVTLLKVFLYDLSQVGSVYRIGALMGVAIIAFVASFLYQRFYNQSANSNNRNP